VTSTGIKNIDTRPRRFINFLAFVTMSPTFSYSNPYTSQHQHEDGIAKKLSQPSVSRQQPSLKFLLEQLTLSSIENDDNESNSLIDALELQLSTTSPLPKWTDDTFKSFIEFFIIRLDSDRVLALFAIHVFPQWSDVQIHQSTKTLLGPLTAAAAFNNKTSRWCALAVVTCLWNALERVHRSVLLNKSTVGAQQPWLDDMTEEQSLSFVRLAVDVLLQRTSVECAFLPLERICTTCVTLLIHLHDSISNLPEQQTLERRLQTEVARLTELSMPMSSCCQLALESLRLLVLLQPSRPPMECWTLVVQSVFGNSSGCALAAPRWTQAANNSRLLLPLLQQWVDVCGDQARAVIARLVLEERSVSKLWSSVLNGQGVPAELVFLVVESRLLARTELNAARLMESLLEYIRTQHVCAPHAAILINQLVTDRMAPTTHDQVSRCLWETVDDALVQSFISVLLQSTTYDPITLSLLDTLYAILYCEPDLCRSALLQASTQQTESLVEFLTAKSNYQDRSLLDASVSLAHIDEDTPPANNLSRIDGDTSILLAAECLDKADECEVGVMELSIHFAAGAVLALMGCQQLAIEHCDGHINLLQGRMVDAVHSYLDGHDFTNHVSLELSRRRLRVITALTTPESEVFLSTLLYTSEATQRRANQRLNRECCRYQTLVEKHRATEKRLEQEKETVQEKLSNQALVFQRQSSQFQRITRHQANQLVQVHQAERVKAERCAEELATRMRDLESRLITAEQVACSHQQSEAQARSALDDATEKLNRLASEQQEAVRRAEESTSKLVDVARELQSTKSSLDAVNQQEKQMRLRLKSQEDSIGIIEHANAGMRDSLESLFGDLSGLAQLYELKEKEINSIREQESASIIKLRRKVDSQRALYAELQERYRTSEDQNEMLSRKYARAREKLEKEREERARTMERRKKNDPVSYLNHPHESTVSESSSSRANKENDNVHSSRHRRTHR
jgi:hypothetical protein